MYDFERERYDALIADIKQLKSLFKDKPFLRDSFALSEMQDAITIATSKRCKPIKELHYEELALELDKALNSEYNVYRDKYVVELLIAMNEISYKIL